VLLAAAEERASLPEIAAWREHLESCPECLRALDDLRSLGLSLAELGRAERQAAPASLWTRVEARLDRPPLVARLPLGLAAACRQAGDFLRPAVAGTATAALAGLVLGTYLAIDWQRGTPIAAASDPFEVSTLLGESASGLAGSYLAAAEDDDVNPAESLDASEAGSATADGRGGAESGTVERDSAPLNSGGRP
jgi:hypothetical protein